MSSSPFRSSIKTGAFPDGFKYRAVTVNIRIRPGCNCVTRTRVHLAAGIFLGRLASGEITAARVLFLPVDTEAYKQLRRVEDTHWWYRAARQQAARLLERFWPSRPRPTRVLDAGCGTGGTTKWLGRYGSVIGIDTHPDALRATGARGIPGVLASAEALPFRDGSFDLVTSFDVIYHARVHSPQASLREMRRVTRVGGRLLLRVPALAILEGPHDRFVHGVRRFRLNELRHELRLAGWRDGWAGYVNALLFLPTLIARRLLPSSSGGDLDRSDRFGGLLFRIQRLEIRLLGRVPLPVGTSLLALMENPSRPGSPE